MRRLSTNVTRQCVAASSIRARVSLCACSGATAHSEHTRCQIRSFMQRSTVLQHPSLDARDGDDDDFVDIDSLAGYGSVGGLSSASSATREGATTTTTMTKTLAPPVIGVVRREEEKEGTEYSRLSIPLDEPRAGKPLDRQNSRSAVWLSGEKEEDQEHFMGKAASERQAAQGSSIMSGSEEKDAFTVDGDLDDRSNVSELCHLPSAGTLPYDDEKFAETLLEMEVEGAIDETWQDCRRAHVEDAKEIAEILRTMKVRDICCMDVSSKTSNFDFMMFGTCEGPRHIHLAAWAAQEADRMQRLSKVRRKQMDELWEVVPIGRIVLNLMVESLREELTLERKWAVTTTMDPLHAANAPVSEGRQVRAHGLWTLTLNLQDLEDFEVDYCKDILLHQS